MREIDNVEEARAWLGADPASAPVCLQDVDLEADSAAILAASFPGSLFLGCALTPEAAGHIVMSGGVVVPDFGDVAFPVHRAHLYRVEELFAGFDPDGDGGYAATWDHGVYAQYLEHGKEARSIRVSLARRLHDHSITDALEEILAGRRVVAIMGGHGMERADPFYAKVARVARTLTRAGYLMVSGGGPGAMEATHVGAWFATRDEAELQAGIDMMKARPDGAEPGKEYADPDWLHRAWRVREAFPISDEDATGPCLSVGIPTWLYGHEPPAVFATRIGKYFANSVREDGLLAIANHGVVFAPGSAGTTQEIFQDAAQNHYRTQGYAAPMILFGTDHWTRVRPVWPLLEHVARGRPYGDLLALTDDDDEVVQRVRGYDPSAYSVP